MTTKSGKNPKGGLNPEGRRQFAKSQGSHLRPGVTKPAKEMNPEEMQRKGSFLRRHYGRKNPFRVIDDDGRPTRYALQAAAWREKVPKNENDIKRLAELGAKLLAKVKTGKAQAARQKK